MRDWFRTGDTVKYNGIICKVETKGPGGRLLNGSDKIVASFDNFYIPEVYKDITLIREVKIHEDSIYHYNGAADPNMFNDIQYAGISDAFEMDYELEDL